MTGLDCSELLLLFQLSEVREPPGKALPPVDLPGGKLVTVLLALGWVLGWRRMDGWMMGGGGGANGSTRVASRGQIQSMLV